jgi:seryl-tRNA synthetase
VGLQALVLVSVRTIRSDSRHHPYDRWGANRHVIWGGITSCSLFEWPYGLLEYHHGGDDMPQYTVRLRQPVPRSYVDELSRRIFFVSEQIEDYSIDPSDDDVTSILIITREPINVEVLARKIDELLTKQVLTQRPPEATTVWRSPHQPQIIPGTFEQLLENGDAVEMGEGQFALGAPLITLMTCLDRMLRDIAINRFAAVEYQYPTLINTDALYRTGYPVSFPHFLMAVSRLHADIDSYEAFLRQLTSSRDLASTLSAHSRHAEYMLPPTMCFHTYHHFRQRRLSSDTGIVVTSRGKSFRYESRYRRGLERLWDFTIREIVFLGSREQVIEQRQSFLAATTDLISQLGLGGYVQVANDSFSGEQTAAQILSQRLLHLKYELRLPVTDGRTVAAGSFNLHGTTFSEPFGIEVTEGRLAHTACVGFGLERFTYAFICQHGADPTRWPVLSF